MANNVLLPSIKRTAKGDELAAVHPIPNKDGEISWYELRFSDPQIKVLMPAWWAESYLTEDVFGEGLTVGMKLNAGYQPVVDENGNAVLDSNGRPRMQFYCVPA